MNLVDDYAREILTLIPSLQGEFEAEVDFFAPDPVEPVGWWATIGQELVRLRDQLEPEVVSRVFAMVEEGLSRGTKLDGDVLATGFLEALANKVSAGELPQEWVKEHAGPEAIAYLRAWDEFSLGHSTY